MESCLNVEKLTDLCVKVQKMTKNVKYFIKYLHEPKVFTTFARNFEQTRMYWTLELASRLDDAPWPATKEELLDYANREGLPSEVIENLNELEGDDEEQYESILDIWPDFPTNDDDFLYNEEEY